MTATSTAEQAHDTLHEIWHMTAHLPDAIATILGLHATPITPTRHTPTAGTPDPIGTIIAQTEEIRGIMSSLHDLAIEWAVIKGETISQPIPLYLATHCAWAAKNWPAWDTVTTIIAETHTQLAHILGYAPHKTSHTCPHCGHQLTQASDDNGLSDILTCHNCEKAWHNIFKSRTLIDAQRAVITKHDIPVTRDQAATILGINRTTLRSWIHRGQLTETNGHISLADATRLANNIK